MGFGRHSVVAPSLERVITFAAVGISVLSTALEVWWQPTRETEMRRCEPATDHVHCPGGGGGEARGSRLRFAESFDLSDPCDLTLGRAALSGGASVSDSGEESVAFELPRAVVTLCFTHCHGVRDWKMAPKKSRIVTRGDSEHFLLGQPSDLQEHVLPTRRHFINCVRRMSSQVDPTTGRQMKPQKAVALVCNRVLDIWAGEGIPTVTQRRVVQLGQVCHTRYSKITKSRKKRREDAEFLAREEEWFSKLFDIARCKCKDPSQCCCARSDKVPPEEVEFLLDQRGERNMGLGPVDQVETQRRQRRRQRIERESTEQKSADRPSASMSRSTKVSRGCVKWHARNQDSLGEGEGERPENFQTQSFPCNALPYVKVKVRLTCYSFRVLA